MLPPVVGADSLGLRATRVLRIRARVCTLCSLRLTQASEVVHESDQGAIRQRMGGANGSARS